MGLKKEPVFTDWNYVTVFDSFSKMPFSPTGGVDVLPTGGVDVLPTIGVDVLRELDCGTAGMETLLKVGVHL